MAGVYDEKRPDLGGNVRHGDIHTWSPNLWRFLIDRYAVRSVLAGGCGEGHAVAFFQRQGMLAHGIEGMQSNVLRAVTPIALHDLTHGPYIMPVDFVWSCEVAEHIDPALVGNFIDTLSNGRVVAMTHALPGQGGHHHVNCQPKEYWIGLMQQKGYDLSDDVDDILGIARAELIFNYFSRSGLVFVRK